MSEILYDATPHAVGEMMDGGGEFQPPSTILNGLNEEEAMVVFPGSPHSIAQILSHTHFYQEATLAKLCGREWSKPEHLEDTFATIEPGTWDSLVSAFLTGVEEVKRLAQEKGGGVSPSRNDTTACYDLAESALHNAYHLGQIVLLRQMMGLWPPATGDTNDF